MAKPFDPATEEPRAPAAGSQDDAYQLTKEQLAEVKRRLRESGERMPHAAVEALFRKRMGQDTRGTAPDERIDD